MVHHGLVHQIGEAVLGFRAPAPEEDHGPLADDGQRAVFGRGVHQHPVAARPRVVRGQRGVDQVEAREVHEPRQRPAGRAHALVLLDDVAPGDRDDELAAAVRQREAGGERHLGVLDPEWRGLAHLPPNHLGEVLGAARDVLEAHERHPGHRVRHHQAQPARPHAKPLHTPPRSGPSRSGR